MQVTAKDLRVIGSVRELEIDITMNHRCIYPQQVNSQNAPGSPEWTQQFNEYAADYENQNKIHPMWVVQDESRNASWTIEPYQDHYLCTVTWDIVGAVFREVIQVDCPFDPGTAEFEVWKDGHARERYEAFFRDRPQWIPL
jgi:hypothetical protein